MSVGIVFQWRLIQQLFIHFKCWGFQINTNQEVILPHVAQCIGWHCKIYHCYFTYTVTFWDSIYCFSTDLTLRNMAFFWLEFLTWTCPWTYTELEVVSHPIFFEADPCHLVDTRIYQVFLGLRAWDLPM